MRLLLLLLLFISPLIPSFSQVSVSPYVATAAELDIEEGGVLYSFKYSGEGDDPAWVVIPDEFGIVEISHFGVHHKRNSSESTLKRVTLPHTLKRIGNTAFEQCRLECVDLNPELEQIGYSAFANNRLSEVALPPSLRECGRSAFSCSPLSMIIWSDDPSCSIERLSGFGLDTMLRYVEIPSYVKALTSDAFLDCDLDSVKFNEGLDSISGAFRVQFITRCRRLRKVRFPNSLRYIDNFSFARNEGLESIEFGAGLKMIGSGSFLGNLSLERLVLPEKLEFIGDAAFLGCRNLKRVAFNPSLRTIAERAFLNCPQLSDYCLPDELVELGREAFRGTRITNLCIPASLKVVPALSFSYCSYAPEARVSFAEGIEEIADSAFYRFVTITEDSRFTDSVTISLPHTLRRIGRSAFEMVWLRQANLPQVDEYGRRLVWNAYLNGVLEKADVKTIGGYMRTGFQRAALYEYVASYPPSDPTHAPSAPQPSVSRVRLYDLSGRKARPASTNLRLPVKRAKSASVLLR